MYFARTIAIFASVLVIACSEPETADNPEPKDRKPTPYQIDLPGNFPDPVYDLSENPLTEEGIALGKMLFYDTRLSRTNMVSCGICHMQPSAFTHHGHDISHGVDDKLGRRNS